MAAIPLVTSQDLYENFLEEIRRERTVVVPGEKYSRIFNKAAIQWVRSKLPENQFNQKRIDDLQLLHVDTDGVFHPMIPVSGNAGGARMLFEVPTTNQTIGGYNYPAYLHGISAMFKIMYIDSTCHANGESELLPAAYLRSDQRSEWLNNEYRRPKDDRLLYEFISGFVRLATGAVSGISKSYGVSMRLEYYRYPQAMWFYGVNDRRNVDSEFPPIINEEIQSIAVMNFLERREDPRLQSFMGVEGTKNRPK
jgi:hypothetical protein